MSHSNKMIILGKALIAWSILIFALGATQSHAFSPGISLNITKASLKSKCRSAGGVFNDKGGAYNCTITKANGHIITVSCDANRDCVGHNGKKQARAYPTTRLGAIAIR